MTTRKWIRDLVEDEAEVIETRPVMPSPHKPLQIGDVCEHCGHVMVLGTTARLSSKRGKLVCAAQSLEVAKAGYQRWVERQRRRGTLRREQEASS